MKKLTLLLTLSISIFLFNCSSDDDVVVQDSLEDDGQVEFPIVNNEFTCNCEAPEASPAASDDMVFEGTIILQTQSQVEAFGAENYTLITGSLIIGFPLSDTDTPLSNISDISALSTIRQVNRQINVSSNPLLSSLNGLRNLMSTSGLVIELNEILTSLDDFENLTTITEGGFNTFVRMAGPASANKAIFINNNIALNSLSGLRNITSRCLNSLLISENDSITTLEGLEGFTEILRVRIFNNNSLIALQGLDNIEIACQLISIANNLNLRSIAELNKIQNSNSIFIVNNNALNSLQGLENLEAVGALNINSRLISLEGLNNLQSANGISIQGTSISSLQGLESLELVNNLSINNNESLTSLQELESLVSINRTLSIENNSNLFSIQGLENITRLSGILNIINNERLISLQGLENLETVIAIVIVSNSNLTSIEALNNIQSTGVISLASNNSLASLQGLENLTEIRQALLIRNNASLNSLESLNNLERISGINLFNGFFIGLDVNDNNVLNDFCALTTLFTNSFSLNTDISGNLFNPTIQNIVSGNCNQ